MVSMWHWLLNHWFTQEKFWVALGSLITASALVFAILSRWRENKSALKNIKSALKIELVTDINNVFKGGVDRPLLFDAIRLLRTDFIHMVKSEEDLDMLQKLYVELEDYDRFAKTVYLRTDIDRRYVTEKHLKLINFFREYFGRAQLEYDIGKLNHRDTGNTYIERVRDQAKEVYQLDGNVWANKLQELVDKVV